MNLQTLRDQYDNQYIDAGSEVKEYDFDVVMTVRAGVAIEATSYEEALEKLYNLEFKNIDVDVDDFIEVNEMVDYEVFD